MSAGFSERERQILLDIECQLACDRRLERHLRTGHVGLRAAWDSIWTVAIVGALLLAGALAALTAGAWLDRPALVVLGATVGAGAVAAVMRIVGLRRTGLRRTDR
ncbi:hypothetical protein P3T37_001444 [Kitasatospora sp. MAA4]|uniref:DUF3040 domain-containing protein n=1 Tax=Kitasatospora sp. MAA4 TaxID=3035093 RepID=UPI0024730942|nr:DUF3040 domain-containing protein [Kitasatospora sp. MAA4]MDH6132059.1 hypothetical protein [Kitasatospora sp. MAA4]